MEPLTVVKSESWLSWFFRGLVFVGFIFLFVRLFELGAIKGDYFRSLSEGNRIRRIPIPAPRGRILARGGEILVDDRVYPLGSAFVHVSGYLGEANSEEVDKINPKCPEKGPRYPGELVGRSGLEAEYECLLSGTDGEELIEVDTSGKKVRTLGIKEPVVGRDLKIWIDYGLQKKVAAVMNHTKSAVVATDAGGEVLALYSSPSYDPSDVSSKLSDADLPLFNRAIGGQFHPGSVFKPFVALAALSEGEITKDFLFDDPGVITVGKFSYSNWFFTQYGRTEGKINVERALARSTDTFFYKVGEMVGVDKLVEWSDTLGLTKKTDIDLPGEVESLVPSPQWKLKVIGEPWFLGNTYHLAIGQGDLSLTPVALHRGILGIANGGRLCSLKIGDVPRCTKLKIAKENLEIVKAGMVAACSPGGTGYTFFDWNSSSTGRSGQVACKTGTAETNEDGKTHAWFVVFAPSDFPEIVLTVIVEQGGEGSKVAGPLAREIMDYWFGREK